MTVYERARLKIRSDMDKELSALDVNRIAMGESTYWNAFKQIQAKYADQVKEVDEAERTQRLLQSEKETGITHDRPEQTYVDILGQMKAVKMTELISKLSQINTNSHIENLSPQDPFYEDKMYPLDTFERWWNEELLTLPSVEYMKEFLESVDISEQGFIVIDESKIRTHADTFSEDDFTLEMLLNGDRGNLTDKTINKYAFDRNYYASVLRKDSFKSTRMRAKEKEEARKNRIKAKTPLFASDERIQARLTKEKAMARINNAVSTLENVVYAYDLNAELEALLVEHIVKVCVPMGITKEDQYKPMLEQFLRYVPEHYKRVNVVKKAIEHNWRVLSDGTI